MIPAFALWLWRSVPHPVLGFPTGLYPVGCEGRIHYIELLLHEEVHVRLGCRDLTRCNALEVLGEDLDESSLVVRGN